MGTAKLDWGIVTFPWGAFFRAWGTTFTNRTHCFISLFEGHTACRPVHSSITTVPFGLLWGKQKF